MDTIAAIATGAQISAIGIIRLSGERAIDCAAAVFAPQRLHSLFEAPDRKLLTGVLRDRQGRIIDHCLCTVSRGPHSYTGEDTAELQCHGSPTVLREALDSLFAAGARQAGPGEFTKRAFLNGRMDLTGAEAVIDLIEAETAEAARNAAGQLGGAILRRAGAISDSLRDICAHYHAVLDYPDEEIEPFELAAYSSELHSAARQLSTLLDSFGRGSIMKQGVPTVILGSPNVGKSTLLNALLGYERAIVTDIPGTTRDTITESVLLGGVLLRLTDTAGLRETEDAVERLGVLRSRQAALSAELALALLDPSDPERDLSALEAAQSAKHVIAVFTKSDLTTASVKAPELGGLRADALVSVSALTGEGLEELASAVRGLYPPMSGVPTGEILTNARQAEAVGRALESVNACLAAIDVGLTPDAALTEAEAAMYALGELTGATVREDVTARIFERFCVGK